jgi:AcrR family transcriptional regulator
MDQMVRRQAADSPAPPVGARPVPAACVIAAGVAAGVAGALGRPMRRRGRELEEAIFEATLDQLTSGGYARLTMEGVAGAARTGKAALYRRWASKVELVIDALESTLPPPADIPDLGSARSELLLLIDRFTTALESRAGSAVHALMNELDHDQAQAQVFRNFVVDRVVNPTKAATLDILLRGERRGDVRPGAANAMTADVAPAMLMYRAKMCDGRLAPGFCTELVDEVLLPMVRR